MVLGRLVMVRDWGYFIYMPEAPASAISPKRRRAVHSTPGRRQNRLIRIVV